MTKNNDIFNPSYGCESIKRLPCFNVMEEINDIESGFWSVVSGCPPGGDEDGIVLRFEMASRPGHHGNYRQLSKWFGDLVAMHKINKAKSSLFWRVRPEIVSDFFYTRFAILVKD